MKILLGRSKSYRLLPRAWPRLHQRFNAWIMTLELALLIAVLVIFGIAQPDLYRTDMWRIGFDNKLNSNPNMVLYAYANHRPLPKIPLIWSLALTNYNVAISIVSLFFLLCKLITIIMRFYFPIIALVSYSALIALYAVSIYGQIGPDYADARYPAPAAWYFRQGCDPARPYGKYRACQIAQASLGVTLVMFTVYLVNLGFALHATWPNEENALCRDEDEDSALSDSKANDGGAWEMHSMNAPVNESAVPFTPRTQAFHILDRRLPQRQEDIQRYA